MDRVFIATKAGVHLRQYAREMGFDECDTGYEVAEPLPVRDLAGYVTYWLVPVICHDTVKAFLALSRDGMLLAYGRYPGAGIPPSYLDAKTAAAALREAFGNGYKEIGNPVFVHDGPPQRVAWAARATGEDNHPVVLFWSFGAVYSRRAEEGVPAALR